MGEQYPYSFGKYRMEAEIGRGGFGTVFRAVDIDLDRPVAVKIMDPIFLRDTRWVASFRREARVMARLDHAHIVPIYEISEEEGRLFLAMKLIDGPDLTKMIAEQGPLPWDVVVDLVGQIASALDFAHQQNVIHRDLKPGNILVSDGQAMLTDFGLAQMMESNSQSISMSGGIAGTYNYMPPEIFNNEDVTPAVDVYALGCVLYEMLVGHMLFDGKTTAAIIGAHLKGTTIDEPLPEGTPPGTREILQIALAKDPHARYASTFELAQELQRISSDLLAAPYAQLEGALANRHWEEALALAAEIRAHNPNYRDIVTLEERSQRGHWSAQWGVQAQQALAEDDFDAAHGALSQWRRVDPENPEMQRVEQELALAEQYVALQETMAGGQWPEAQAAADAIYAQDPSFRDIAILQATINASLLAQSPQDKGSDPPQQPPPTQSKPAVKGSLPRWFWLIAALLGLLILVFGIRAIFSGDGEVDVEEAVPDVEEAIEEQMPTEVEAIEEEMPAEEETVREESSFEGLTVAAENCDYGGKISSIAAINELTVQFRLCRNDPAFLAKIAFVSFGIQSQEWLEATGGSGDLLKHPVGTGPYMVENWVRGEKIVFKRFDNYWGEPAPAETAVLRWTEDSAARLLELQSGTVDFITNVTLDEFEAIRTDPNLQLIQQDNPTVIYAGFTNTIAPFDDVRVRQALAMGIDRQRIVDNFYPEGSEVASHFTPCSIPNGCQGDEWYDFDPEAARLLMAEAGYPDGFETKIYQGYEDPVAGDIQDQLLENLGIEAEIVVMESGEYIAESAAGNLDGIFLSGWGADYPHVTNFLDFHFSSWNPRFGNPHAEIYEPLEEASQISDLDLAAPFYEQVNNAIREQVPMVPIVNYPKAHAALANVEGAYYPPFGANEFYRMDPGKDTLVYMQSDEPISLYCADEIDIESLRPCQQAVENLFEYKADSGDVVPELATACESNEDGNVWTCTLREGVEFHDGTILDANDVVTSWAAGIDASNPLHVGNTGSFYYFSYLWDGFMNGGQ